MKPETMIRVNSRITKEQHKLIKVLAKKHKKSEGEILRIMLSYFISKNGIINE